MLCQGTGILAIWHDLEPSDEADFQQWQFCEHLPERLSVPGFLRASRYGPVSGTPRLFNFYQTESPQTLYSDAYLERLNNPTPWTQRIMTKFRNTNRTAGQVLFSAGSGEGGAIATLRVSPNEDRREAFGDWLRGDGLPATLTCPGVVATHLWGADAKASLIETSESRARAGDPQIADWAIAIEAVDADAAKAAAQQLRDQAPFSGALRAGSSAELGVYQLRQRAGG